MSEKCLTCEVYSRYCCKCVVHGEGKEEALPNYDTPYYICKKAANLHEPWCSRGVSKQAHLATMPSSAPTREEWEAWAKRLSTALAINDYYSKNTQRLDIEQVLLSMPIVPK